MLALPVLRVQAFEAACWQRVQRVRRGPAGVRGISCCSAQTPAGTRLRLGSFCHHSSLSVAARRDRQAPVQATAHDGQIDSH